MKFSDMLSLSDNELKDLLSSLNQELLNIKVKSKMNMDKLSTNKTRLIKKDIARLLTLFRMKEINVLQRGSKCQD
jgi:ribosomal protein L29